MLLCKFLDKKVWWTEIKWCILTYLPDGKRNTTWSIAMENYPTIYPIGIPLFKMSKAINSDCSFYKIKDYVEHLFCSSVMFCPCGNLMKLNSPKCWVKIKDPWLKNCSEFSQLNMTRKIDIISTRQYWLQKCVSTNSNMEILVECNVFFWEKMLNKESWMVLPALVMMKEMVN